MAIRALELAAVTSFCLLAAPGCATLPDTDALIERRTAQAARFENASGPLSARKSAAILAELKRKSGDMDILEPQGNEIVRAIGSTLDDPYSLLEGGVKLYERAGALLHSKTAVIDGVWSTVGSTNLDWRSFLDNDEINAVILGREFGQQR